MKKIVLLCLVAFALVMGCASTAQNMTTIKDLSVVPAKSNTATQLEGIYRFVNKTKQGEAILELTFFGNQFINASKLANGNFPATNGIFNAHDGTLELYNINVWEDSGSDFYLRWENLFQRRKDAFSLGIWHTLPYAQVPPRKQTYTYTLENNQLTLNDGKNSFVLTKVDTQAVELVELAPYHFAELYDLNLNENESVVIIHRQSARDASKSKNSRINNDFQIRIDGNTVTTFGGGRENAATVQLDSVFGNDTETAFIVPNGTHTLDINGRAGIVNYKSNVVEFTARSSMISFGAIWKGRIKPNLTVEKSEELIYDEKLDRMVIR